MKNVSHRNAPGAISAIALTVSPVRPSVEGGFAAGAVVVDAGDIWHSLFCGPVSGRRDVCYSHHRATEPLRPVRAERAQVDTPSTQLNPAPRSSFGWCTPVRRESRT